MSCILGNYLLKFTNIWARSSVVERCPDKTEVEGPIPSAPTKLQFNILSREQKRELARLYSASNRPVYRKGANSNPQGKDKHKKSSLG